MTPNECRIYSDDICVYVKTSIKASLIGKVLLISVIIMFTPAFFVGIQEGIIGIVLFSLIVEALLIRYALWNFYGNELLVINTKSVSWQFDYGFFKTKLQTKPISRRLITERAVVTKDEAIKQVQINFISYDDNDLPIYIHQAGISISEKDADKLDEMIEHLYINKITDDLYLPDINLN